MSDSSDNAILKLGDFGLSEVVFAAELSTPRISTGAIPNGDSSLLQKSYGSSAATLASRGGIGLRQGGSPSTAVCAVVGAMDDPSAIRRLKSVVGSPHYVAPEVMSSAIG